MYLPNFRALIVVVYHHPSAFIFFSSGCLQLRGWRRCAVLHWSSSQLKYYIRGPTLYVQVHADNKGEASVSRGTHNFLNRLFKIQSTNESHRFSENPHSIVKKIVCRFRKKIHMYRKGKSRIESFEEKVMCFLKTFAFLLFAFWFYWFCFILFHFFTLDFLKRAYCCVLVATPQEKYISSSDLRYTVIIVP